MNSELFYSKTLKNGLPCKFYTNPYLHHVTLSVVIRAGVIYEGKGEKGISHFLEHMFFRKMPGMTQQELYYEMERIGTSLKGATYKNYIKFSMTVSPEYFTEGLDILCRIFKPIEWTTEEIRKEKKVVMNQILFQSYFSFRKIVDNIYFKGTGWNNPIMGNKSSVKSFTQKQIYSKWETMFVPENACFIVTGNATKEQLGEAEALMAQKYRETNTAAIRKMINPEYFTCREEGDIYFDEVKWDISDVLISFDIPENVNYYEAKLLNSILGEGVGSQCSVLLREEWGITNEVFSEMEQFPGGKRILIECCVETANLSQCLEGLLQCIKELKTTITQKELDTSKVFYTKNYYFLLDDAEQLSDFLAQNFLHDEPDLKIEDIYYKFDQITAEQLIQTAQGIFQPKNLLLMVSNNKDILNNARVLNLLKSFRQKLKE